MAVEDPPSKKYVTGYVLCNKLIELRVWAGIIPIW